MHQIQHTLLTPTHRHNKLARAQSDAPDERSNFKDNMTLFHLDQYARSRLPRYTGFRPQVWTFDHRSVSVCTSPHAFLIGVPSQHSRNLSLFVTRRPCHCAQAPRNITLEQPSQGPPKCTTQGAANFQTTKNGVPFVDKTHHNNMKEGGSLFLLLILSLTEIMHTKGVR